MTESTREDLIRRARAGERASLDLLWRQHRRYVAAVLLAQRCLPSDELEDLLQEVAVVFVRKVAEVRTPAAFRGWLRTVTLNVLRERSRRARSRPRALSLEGTASGEADASLAADPGLDRFEGEEERQRVLDAPSRLPEEQREVLVLKVAEGASQREIARQLGVPETTVESRLARARRRLRSELGELRADSERNEPQ